MEALTWVNGMVQQAETPTAVAGGVGGSGDIPAPWVRERLKLILRESVMDVREGWNCPFIKALRRMISEFILPICE